MGGREGGERRVQRDREDVCVYVEKGTVRKERMKSKERREQ